jgi:hypothetical protein
MSNYFEIDSVQPPVGARPVGSGFRPMFPQSDGVDGDGRPVGAVGKLMLVIAFESLSPDAWDWWVDQLSGATYASFTTISWFNPYKSGGAGWEEWTGGGILHRPTFQAIDSGNYHGVEIRITDMMP